MSDHAATVREALGLLSSMVASRESHTLTSVERSREAHAALDALVAERDEAQRLLREVVKADRQDAQMGYPIAGDSCMGAFIGLVLMQYLDGLAAPTKEGT